MVIDEIKRKSFELGLPISTIWRSGLWKNLAFKGGTCLKKAYFRDYRFSEDLDYTLIEEVNAYKLRERLERMLEFANTGPVEFLELEFEPRYEVRSFEGKLLGFEIKIPFRLVRKTGTPSKIKIGYNIRKVREDCTPVA
ncbi:MULTISPECIES: nucleotidyl transferase AbiEii/AbiGii toxin family protein [unclassified Thermococcus]|uniref:nucleotidyl transferase AbiEii/AbiGii toxin family protein n=1 Tax=unclassified Thermococcus TaxID=2627626 RepID=UPI002106C19E|nr:MULTISPECIES: nucleotidyl transferase AbiEii/AbiGii toxin family protein [unclassified Thermococcus]